MIETGVDAGLDREAHPRKVTAGALGRAQRGRRPRKAPRRLRRDQDHEARAGAHGRLGGRARKRHRLDRALRLGNEGNPARRAARRTAGGGGPAAEEPIAEPEAEEPIADEPEPIAEPEEPAAEEPSLEEPIAEEPLVEEPLVEESEAAAEQPQPARVRRGFWGWLFRTRTGGPEVAPEPVAAEPEPAEPVAAEPEPEPEPARPSRSPSSRAGAGAGAGRARAGAGGGQIDPEAEPVEDELEPVVEEAEPEEAEPAVDPERARAILDEALDALGAAHHRPFSRG